MIYLTLFDHFLINLGYKIVKFKYLKLLTIYLLNNTLKKGNILKDFGGLPRRFSGHSRLPRHDLPSGKKPHVAEAAAADKPWDVIYARRNARSEQGTAILNPC